MIATWMLYCSLCALGLALAALLAERALLAGGGQVRFVWVGAVALSLLVPAAAFRYAPRPTLTVANPTFIQDVAVDAPLNTAVDVAAPAVTVQPQSPRWNWRATIAMLPRANRPLTIAWVALSSALVLYFVVGIVALARLRRRWQRRDVLGVAVLVSERTGPAIVGVVAPAIVMPEWALAMAPQQLALMLRHEEEHQRVGDAQLLAAAQLALIVMPWNVALWWLIARLGMAVELDCDARVLRHADARSYGDLLLEVARPRRSLPLLGATAFAERAGQLERRIRAIARRRDRVRRGARVAAAFIGLAAVTTAWVAPRPSAPPLPAPSDPTTLASPIVGATAPLRASTAELPPSVSTTARPSLVRSDARVDDRLLNMPSVVPPAQLAVSRPSSPLVDSVFNRLFVGIALSLEQESAIRQLIATLEQRQVTNVTSVMLAAFSVRPAFEALSIQRNSALRALLATDGDRTVFDDRAAQEAAAPTFGGARGRSGGAPPPDGFGGGARGGGRGARSGGGGGGGDLIGGGRARGGGGGGRGAGPLVMIESGRVPTFQLGGTDEAFQKLLGGLALTPEQEASARTIIANTRREASALLPESPMDELVLLRPEAVLMRAESKSLLLALLGSEADRSVVGSRIAVETRIVKRMLDTTPPKR